MHVAIFFLTHWFQFNYMMPHEVWYRAADWSNVFVMLPIAILGFLYIRSRHLAVIESHKALKAAHVEHAEKLDKLLAKLDPETPGSLVAIEDMLNPKTPTGIGEIIKRLDGRSGQQV
jgi:hypothetical protein